MKYYWIIVYTALLPPRGPMDVVGNINKSNPPFGKEQSHNPVLATAEQSDDNQPINPTSEQPRQSTVMLVSMIQTLARPSNRAFYSETIVH